MARGLGTAQNAYFIYVKFAKYLVSVTQMNSKVDYKHQHVVPYEPMENQGCSQSRSGFSFWIIPFFLALMVFLLDPPTNIKVENGIAYGSQYMAYNVKLLPFSHVFIQ
jgi:hypothetical protein